jgi:cardiolipin synthase
MWNIPNTLTLIRLAGIPILLLFAFGSQPVAVFLLGCFLVLTDWLDGFLARTLHQQTPLGAKLDTVADACLGLSLVACVAWLDLPFLKQFWGVIAGVLGSYALSSLGSLLKFGIWPSYHNLLAKLGMAFGSLTGLMILARAAGWWAPPLGPLFLFTSGLITLANIEAMLITFRLRHPRSNVASIFSLCRRPEH